MTSAEIRQSFLDFFKSKGHTIVPSSSLMPDSPNLLFTNAGMNQFVPIFLGQRAPDVSKWSGAIPGSNTRAADTQKCIRAGGKHNDLEDVGLDTYHHTFFEMLGNWSFGDYFKKAAITWAWELVTEVWKFPKNRLYATVYSPDKTKGDPSDFDQEAYDIWADKFRMAGLDPKVHVVHGNKKDNFWMMGDTGPCGPCSEIHVDLTPADDTKGSLVNKGDARCIEIWNLVFIQFNANPDGTFSPLPAKHVDTGMGFERVTGIMQNTRNFTDFSRVISNYETDIFRPIFDKLERSSGKKYGSTLPAAGTTGTIEQEKIDVAFRVIADHIRTLSFAIADGIQPGNTDRNYVLRRILRRAVRYGRSLGFHEPFFYKLVSVLADTMGHVFPEIRAKQDNIEQVIQREEEAFTKTLDTGTERLDGRCAELVATSLQPSGSDTSGLEIEILSELHEGGWGTVEAYARRKKPGWTMKDIPPLSAEAAFELYDTYGFPLDLTELMARERGLVVDVAGFNKLMEEQKARARAAQKKTVVNLQEGVDLVAVTRFVGYDATRAPSRVLNVFRQEKRWAVVLEVSPFYAEMGGQVGDTGTISAGPDRWPVVDTNKVHLTWLHFIDGDQPPLSGTHVSAEVDIARRFAIQRHHTVTHLLHWALHEVVSKNAVQKGSYVGPDKLTFDFSSAPLTSQQVADVEKLVNERILENALVTWRNFPYADVKTRQDIMQLFGEKYGDQARVVQIGGRAGELDGYSMELCGGTHTRATGEIGLFRIAAESAIAAGIRRIEAVSGLEAYRRANEELQLIKTLSGKVNSPVGELEKKVESLLAQQKELEKQLKVVQQKQAVELARSLASKAQDFGKTRAIIEDLGAGDGDFLQTVADALKGQFKGVVVLGSASNGAVALVATVSPELTKQIQAGKIIQAIAPIVGGKGGGRPDNARGGGKEVGKLDEALALSRKLLEEAKQ
ncbi:MAG TPA: alanine--tRNA ligase [Candidatus Acidoferrum sp.]|jgi:alanyl-tRNA synthetase|nr:alanine--tRNA ligase [Candidatus Acidoferrum sp.]